MRLKEPSCAVRDAVARLAMLPEADEVRRGPLRPVTLTHQREWHLPRFEFMKMISQNLHLCNTHFFMTLKPQNISQIPNQIAVN